MVEMKKNDGERTKTETVLSEQTPSFEPSNGRRSMKGDKKIDGEVYGTASTAPATESVPGRFLTHGMPEMVRAIQ